MRDHCYPHRLVHTLTDISCHELSALGVRGVIVDLDNTLTPWKSTTLPEAVIRWVTEMRKADIGVCVVSNAATTRRVRPIAEQLGIPWVTRAGKPLARGFRRGMALLGTTPATTAMIGDQVFTDILGGNLLGLYTILVDPVSTREAWITRLLQRPLERKLGRRAKLVANWPPA